MITTVSYRLGAEELLELGNIRKGPVRTNRPYLAGRKPMLANPTLGGIDILSILGTVAQYLAQGLGFALNTIGSIVEIPLDILGQGVDIAFNGIAGGLRYIPVLGDLLAEIVLVGGAIIKFALTIPGLLLHEFGNILEGIGKYLDDKLTPAEKEQKLDDAEKKLIDEAPEPIRDNVKAILDAAGVSGRDIAGSISGNRSEGQDIADEINKPGGVTEPTPDLISAAAQESFIEKALPIAIPVAAAGVLIAVLA